jgi:hypothetical protein
MMMKRTEIRAMEHKEGRGLDKQEEGHDFVAWAKKMLRKE